GDGRAEGGGGARPVGGGGGGGAGRAGGDGGVQLVRAGTALPQRPLDERLTLGDHGAVPPAAVLVGQQDQVAAGADPGVPPGIGEQQQREQPGHLRPAGQQPRQ